MARSRNIKPSFFCNDVLADTEPLARLLFIGLWTIADREGRLEYRPKRIKAEILPYDDVDVEKLIKQLSDGGFLIVYRHLEIEYIQVVNFTKHQNPHMKEQASTIPAPDLHSSCHADSLNPLIDSLNPLPRKTQYEFSEEVLQAWKKAYPNVDIDTEIAKAFAWETSNPKNAKKNKERFVNSWLSRAKPSPAKPKDTSDNMRLQKELMGIADV